VKGANGFGVLVNERDDTSLVGVTFLVSDEQSSFDRCSFKKSNRNS
jgi:hypothetical protein